MKPRKFRISPLRATASPAFFDASADELRVLIALIEAEGEEVAENLLAKTVGLSESRVRSAITLWEAEGVIKSTDGNITDEFEYSEDDKEITSLAAAQGVRDEMLEDMLTECAALLGKPALSTEDIKAFASIYTELSLSCEYILNLTSYLKSKKKRLTSKEIKRMAQVLSERGYKTVEELEIYIKSTTKEENDIWEIRKKIGIHDRGLSDDEVAYFKKWLNDYGFGIEIINEAFNVTTLATGTAYLPYMDSVLTNWKNAGLTTAAECRALSKNHKNETEEEKKPKRRRAKTEEPKLRYGNFDIDEAIEAALERSFEGEEK
ncbi:MAG: DnaD domain protein [Clostridia bacterium]|nr:DnaD domain protein [Clostridia bacterium]